MANPFIGHSCFERSVGVECPKPPPKYGVLPICQNNQEIHSASERLSTGKNLSIFELDTVELLRIQILLWALCYYCQ